MLPPLPQQQQQPCLEPSGQAWLHNAAPPPQWQQPASHGDAAAAAGNELADDEEFPLTPDEDMQEGEGGEGLGFL